MKELLLQIAGVKTEAEFYKKFPSKEAFFKAYPEAQKIIAQYQQQEMMANAPENSEEQMMDTEEEMVEQMASGGNVPTNPGLWSRAKAAAKAKYDVYPSAYANGFAAKWYKEKGGSWKKAAMGGYINEYANGGGINNPGFKALPKSVQDNIIANMFMGGEVEEYKNGGYTVRRSNDRKGKTHVVTGPDGTKKYFGDPKLGERSKSKYGKDAFYARHAKNLKNNPYFRAYARSTWQDGGIIPEMEELMMAGNYYNMGGYVEYPTMYPDGGSVDKVEKLLKSAKDVWMDQPVKAFNNSQFKKDLNRLPEKTREFIKTYTNPELRELYNNYQMGNNEVRGLTKEEIENNKKYELELLARMARGVDNFQYPMKYGKIGNENNLVNSRFINGGMIAGPMMGYEDDEFMYAMGGGININPANKGKFTEWAASRGMGVQEAANKVMANKEKYPTNVVQMANFARNAAKWKKQDGGDISALNTLYNKMPVQTESYQGQPEQVVLPDGTIESVNATQSHENMSDNQITDVLPTGSHIQSSRNKYTPAQYQQLIDMFTPEVAKERMEQIAQITKGKNKKISPAEISEYAKNKYQKQSTPNSFDTNKLKESNKQSFVDLSIQMNDLIKAGKELAEGQMYEEQMMAYGGMVNKYQDGTGGLNYFVNELLTPGVVNLVKNTSFDKNRGKYRLNVDPNMSLQDKISLAAASEDYGIKNLIQGKNKDFSNFVGGFTPQDFEKRIVYANEGPKGLENKSDLDIRKKAFKYIGYKETLDDKTLLDVKSLYNSPRFKEIYSSFTNYLPKDKFRKTRGDDFMMGAEHFDALGNYVEPTPVVAAVTPETPAQKAADLELARINAVAGARQMPMQNRFNYGLLEGQLGRGLSANEAYLNAALDLDPLYIMETPDTYIRSRKNEIPIGNILYNIEKAQRNSANALAAQTGDWSTLASNIANAGASAMNQVGDTLSALNTQNVGLYNTTQGLQQGLLGENIDVRNQNLTNAQNMANLKRNLLGQKAVRDAELYSQYAKSMGENTQKEQNQRLELLNIMAAKPDMFRGEQGQRFANQIMGNYGSFNNPFAGSPLDFIFSNIGG